ncbi:MAG: hypothetical protein E6Q43_01220 [Dokdonella sp.]|jgi:hypothetical protein|nr:MAG: hypothetical protein E6Q43_01220 [Dokdonella sp.]
MTATTLQDAVDELGRLGCKPVKSGDGYTAFCPVHESDGNGHKPSLTLKAGDTVPLVLNCHAGCDGREILKLLGVNGTAHKSASVTATYRYQGADGRDVREKLRYEPKDFRIRHRDAAGNWVYKAGDGPPVLYRLPELIGARAQGDTVFLTEGEKDADRLASAGLVATTNIEGAAQPHQRPKWKPEYTAQLSGAARVVLLPDNDGPGRAHMRHIAAQLAGKVAEVRWLELSGLPAKGDVSDWLKAGHTVDELKELASEAPQADDVLQQTDEHEAEHLKWLRGFGFLTADNLVAEIETGGTLKISLFNLLAESKYPNAWGRVRPATHLARTRAPFLRHDCYYPGEQRIVTKPSTLGVIEPLLNTYNKPIWPEPRHDANHEEMITDHLMFICGQDEGFVNELLNFMALLVQKPGQRVNWVPLLIAPETGTGRGLLLQIMQALLGDSNVGIVGNNSIGGNFHDALIYKQLICIDEFKMFEDSTAKLNEFKTFVTEPRVSANRKNRAQITIDNTACFIAFSNYENAISIDRTERRYMVAINYNSPKPKEHYRRLATTFIPRNGGSLDGLLYMLLNRDLNNFNPHAPAIRTEAKDAMIDRGMSPAQRLLKRFAEDRKDVFAHDLFTFDEFEKCLRGWQAVYPYGEGAFSDFKLTAHSTARALNSIGARNLGQKRLTDGAQKESVYAIRGVERWLSATEGEIRSYIQGRTRGAG